jgi:hypothetical protein
MRGLVTTMGALVGTGRSTACAMSMTGIQTVHGRTVVLPSAMSTPGKKLP